MEADNRLFVGIYPAGFAYADRSRESQGDYKRLGFLDFGTLTLEIEPDCPEDLADAIKKHADGIQARAGETMQVSTSGQTVVLGHDLNLDSPSP